MNEDDEVNSQVKAEDPIGLSEKNAVSHPEDKNKVEEPNDEGEDNGTTEDETVESSKITELENRNKELEEALLRAKAELDNFRKRAAKDVQSARKFGTEKFVKEILPLKDSLELGVASAEEGTEISAVKEGFDLTLKMFSDTLGRLEVKELDPIDESFDPEKHQAMTTEYVEGKPSGVVVKVFQKGYLLHERLVRPALVVVSSEKTEKSS